MLTSNRLHALNLLFSPFKRLNQWTICCQWRKRMCWHFRPSAWTLQGKLWNVNFECKCGRWMAVAHFKMILTIVYTNSSPLSPNSKLRFKKRWSLTKEAAHSFWLVELSHSDASTVLTGTLHHERSQESIFFNRNSRKKYLKTCNSLLNSPNRSSASIRRTTNSTVSTPARSLGTKPIPSHVAWLRVSCFEDRLVIIRKPGSTWEST